MPAFAIAWKSKVSNDFDSTLESIEGVHVVEAHSQEEVEAEIKKYARPTDEGNFRVTGVELCTRTFAEPEALSTVEGFLDPKLSCFPVLFEPSGKAVGWIKPWKESKPGQPWKLYEMHGPLCPNDKHHMIYAETNSYGVMYKCTECGVEDFRD